MNATKKTLTAIAVGAALVSAVAIAQTSPGADGTGAAAGSSPPMNNTPVTTPGSANGSMSNSASGTSQDTTMSGSTATTAPDTDPMARTDRN